MLKGSLCWWKFVPAGALWTTMGFVGSDQLQLGLCSHPAHRPGAHLSLALDHSTSACTAEVLVISWAATVPSSGHEPCLFWILTCGLILTRPQTSFITKQLLMDWVFGCHPQACPACCAWLLWGCTLTARRLPCQLHCAWLPAPCLSDSRWFLLYFYSNCALANKIDVECYKFILKKSCQQIIKKIAIKINNTKHQDALGDYVSCRGGNCFCWLEGKLTFDFSLHLAKISLSQVHAWRVSWHHTAWLHGF